MGSRYGGLKQLDGVGPNGEVIMEYSIHDAMKAGVNRVVFVIRESFEEDFRSIILSRLPSSVKVELCYQEFSDLPSEFVHTIDWSKRLKPWGTGHAVWAARHKIDSPFLAINADDYYGPQAFRRLAEHLRGKSEPEPCMVGFRLANTLSPSGTVSRGVCEVSQGSLQGITERTKLRRSGPQVVIDEVSVQCFPVVVVVSMNCWGFGANFMPFLEDRFSHYLRDLEDSEAALQKGEFYLPVAVDQWRALGQGEVTVLVSEEPWLGVTYPEDKDTVVQGLRQRIESGVYSEALWSRI